MKAEIRTHIENSLSVKQALLRDEIVLGQIEALARICNESLQSGGKIIFTGNGGSFADAQHLAAEFVGRFATDRAPLAAIALGTNNSALTAIGNDYGFEQIFARELRALAKPGDVFIPISTSGNSQNIIAAVEVARGLHIRTIGLTGQSGGYLKQLCECIRVPSAETPRIQECHILIGHILCALVEKEHLHHAKKFKTTIEKILG
jgi:D-sedoheptulose 7-phosphate isomerase